MSNKQEGKEHLNSSKDFRPTKYEDYGYFFFPERFGNVHTPSWYEKFFSYGSSREIFKKSICKRNVQDAIEKRSFF
jgi:hypothetical protein